MFYYLNPSLYLTNTYFNVYIYISIFWSFLQYFVLNSITLSAFQLHQLIVLRPPTLRSSRLCLLSSLCHPQLHIQSKVCLFHKPQVWFCAQFSRTVPLCSHFSIFSERAHSDPDPQRKLSHQSRKLFLPQRCVFRLSFWINPTSIVVPISFFVTVPFRLSLVLGFLIRKDLPTTQLQFLSLLRSIYKT